MKIPEAKTAVDQDWNKLLNFRAWNFKKVNPEAEVVRQEKKRQNIFSLCISCVSLPPEACGTCQNIFRNTGVESCSREATSRTTTDTKQCSHKEHQMQDQTSMGSHRGLSPVTSFGDRIKADHKFSNLENVS